MIPYRISSAGSLISSYDSSSSGGTTQFLSGFVRYIPYILIGLVLFMLLLIVLIILLARTYHRRKAQDDEPEYSQTAQLEPLDDTLSTPADPEDIQLDSNAFAQWKEATQKIPVMKMTEVHTTTIQEVTGILPDLISIKNRSLRPRSHRKHPPRSLCLRNRKQSPKRTLKKRMIMKPCLRMISLSDD